MGPPLSASRAAQARALPIPPCTATEPAMNHDDPTHRSPPRAEPIQPDRPGRGDDKQSRNNPARPGDPAHADKLKKQEEAAVENTREGYGG
jgi:hypothetical protein